MNAAKAFAVGGLILAGTAGLAYTPHRLPRTMPAPEPPREPLLSEIIEPERAANDLPPFLIEAVIAHESRFDEFAMNPEKRSRCYQNARGDDERSACASRGLMQVQFAGHGSGLHFHDDLFVVRENIHRGAKWLGHCYRAAGGNLWKTLGCYNGDRSGRYASAVLDWHLRLKRHAEQLRKNQGRIG